MRVGVLSISLTLFLAACQSRREPADLPDPVLTPGDVLDVTKDEICAPKYPEKVRDVPVGIKRRVYAAYRRERSEGVCCEVDHLVPLELGGSNREGNLWPEPYVGVWNAHVKDRLEARLHRLVCSGELELKTAQEAIAKNWISAYHDYEESEPAPHKRRPRR